MHPTFLERDSQVDALLGYAAEADAGAGRLVLVQGEAGGGKSTLLEQVEARLPDATWHWGACDGLFTPLPLAPLRDIAESIGGPLLAGSRADASRDTLFAALLEAVRNDPGLTVLAFEDVQWADEATLDLLRFLGRRIQKERALLLVTFREEEFGSSGPLRKALGELSRQRATRRVALPPLSRTAVQQLVGDTGLDPAEVHRLTGGNAYFVAEVVGSAGRGLPASARDAVLARAELLDPVARGLLDAAALAGNRVDPALLEAVAQAPRGGIRHARQRRPARLGRPLPEVQARDRPPVRRGCRARATAHEPPRARPRRTPRARRRRRLPTGLPRCGSGGHRCRGAALQGSSPPRRHARVPW